MQSKSSTSRLMASEGRPPANLQQTPNLQDSAKPKGFPSGGGGSKRLQPIKATALRNMDMVGSPSVDSNIDIKKSENMMRMTQPSSTDSANNLAASDDQNNNKTHHGYSSMTNFGVKRQKGPSSMIDRNSSKGTFMGRNSTNRQPSGGPKPHALPSIDHAKNMEKLRSITGKSEDFAVVS